jgi:hypothetical protein
MLVALLAFAPACDRAVEPYVPGEKPQQPDLARIFPEGARRSAEEERSAGAAPAGMPGAAAGGAPGAAAAGSGQPLQGTITLAPGLEGRVPPGSILFLIARRSEAGPPLAVKRVPDPKLPLDFSIGPDDRMIKQMPFVGPIRLTARLDSDGNAMTRRPGDLQGSAPGEYQPGATGVSIVIDQVIGAGS